MAHQTNLIELDCPACSVRLALDAGFGGGVCRCSNCGTLMTVPADPRHDHAERLSRPEQPTDQPRPPAPSSAPQPPAEVEQTYVTDTGRAVHITPGTTIPTAQLKRKVVRTTTAMILLLAMAAVVGVCVLAVNVLLRSGDDETPPVSLAELFSYDPDRNPLLLDEPNVLGLPLRDSTVVIIDTSWTSRKWLSLAGEMVARGTASLGRDARCEVIFAGEDGLTRIASGELAATVEQVHAAGAADLNNALRAALDNDHDVQQVILVTGQPFEPDQVVALASVWADHPAVTFDIVLIDAESNELAAMAQRQSGRCVTLPSQRLGQWYRRANTLSQ